MVIVNSQMDPLEVIGLSPANSNGDEERLARYCVPGKSHCHQKFIPTPSERSVQPAQGQFVVAGTLKALVFQKFVW